jgi:hypothetical protein
MASTLTGTESREGGFCGYAGDTHALVHISASSPPQARYETARDRAIPRTGPGVKRHLLPLLNYLNCEHEVHAHQAALSGAGWCTLALITAPAPMQSTNEVTATLLIGAISIFAMIFHLLRIGSETNPRNCSTRSSTVKPAAPARATQSPTICVNCRSRSASPRLIFWALINVPVPG